jgi:hypothetical protein
MARAEPAKSSGPRSGQKWFAMRTLGDWSFSTLAAFLGEAPIGSLTEWQLRIVVNNTVE